jgi:hypothetical protein
MMFKFFESPRFQVWGEEGTQRRFVRFEHPSLTEAPTFLLEQQHIAQLIDALQRELPPGAYSQKQSIQ